MSRSDWQYLRSDLQHMVSGGVNCETLEKFSLIGVSNSREMAAVKLDVTLQKCNNKPILVIECTSNSADTTPFFKVFKLDYLEGHSAGFKWLSQFLQDERIYASIIGVDGEHAPRSRSFSQGNEFASINIRNVSGLLKYVDDRHIELGIRVNVSSRSCGIRLKTASGQAYRWFEFWCFVRKEECKMLGHFFQKLSDIMWDEFLN